MKKIIAVAVTFAAVAGLSSIATAGLTNKTVNACVNPNTKALQVANCKTAWNRVDWNRRGPQGVRGYIGYRGPRGFTGDDGLSGASGVYTNKITGWVAPLSNMWVACDDSSDTVIGGGYKGASAGVAASFPNDTLNGGQITWAADGGTDLTVYVICMA